MLLAEALQERADIHQKIQQLSARLQNVALVQEGVEPAEDPDELLQELSNLTQRLEELMVRINLTNAQTACDGHTLTELLAHRDTLSLKIEVLRSLVSKAADPVRRTTRSEIRIYSSVDVRQLQKKLDGLQKELRRTDNLLQAMNWKTELQ